jgi:hypothetical protein
MQLLPHSDNDRQPTGIDFCLSIFGYLSVNLWNDFIYNGLAAFGAKTMPELFVSP